MTRENLGPYANNNEDIQTRDIKRPEVNEEYTFSLDLSRSESWGHSVGSDFFTYDYPAKLRIWGGDESCEKGELLWESEGIQHTNW